MSIQVRYNPGCVCDLEYFDGRNVLSLHSPANIDIAPGEHVVVEVGISVMPSSGHYCHVVGGDYMLSQDLVVVNTVMDPSCFSDIKVYILNIGQTPQHIETADEIAGLYVSKSIVATIDVVYDFNSKGYSGQ